MKNQIFVLSILGLFLFAGNNSSADTGKAQLQIKPADIVFTDELNGAELQKGRPARINITVRNIGASATTEPFNVQFKELAEDGTIRYVDNQTILRSLASGDSLSESFLWIPSSWGRSKLEFKAFFVEKKGELQNNAESTVVIVKELVTLPELIIRKIGIKNDSRLSARREVILESVVENISDCEARDVDIDFFSAQDGKNETKIGQAKISVLPAMASQAVELSWIPDAQGKYTVKVLLDAQKKIKLADRTGNILARDFNVEAAEQIRSIKLSLDKITDEFVILNWAKSENTDFAKYELHMSNIPDFKPAKSTVIAVIDERDITTYDVGIYRLFRISPQLTGALEQTPNYFKLRVFNKGGRFKDSNMISIARLLPSSLMRGEVKRSSVELSWSKNTNPGFESYKLSCNGQIIWQTNNEDDVRHAVTKLTPDTTYDFSLITTCLGLAAQSSTLEAKTKSVLTKVTLRPPVLKSSKAIILEWSCNTPELVEYYEVYKSNSANFVPGPFTKAGPKAPNSASNYRVTGLEPDTNYYFKIVAYDNEGESIASNEVNQATGKAPKEGAMPSVNDFRVSDVGPRMVVLSWGKFEGEDFYKYTIQMERGDLWIDYMDILDKDATSATLEKLSPLTKYTIRLVAQDISGISIQTLPIEVTTPDIAKVKLEPDAVFSNSARLKWSKYEGVDFLSYELYLSKESNFELNSQTLYKKIEAAEETTLDVKPLTMSADYYALLRVNSSKSGVIDSEQLKFTTLANQPPTAVIESILPDPAKSNENVIFTGSGSDSESDIVQYQWISDISGLLGEDKILKAGNLVVGRHNIKFMVKDSDGAWSAPVSQQLIVLKPNIPPDVKILSINPSPASTQDKVVLTGEASKKDGKVIEFKWTSDIDGALGDQAIITATNLAAGKHEIIFSAKDDSGDWSAPAKLQLEVLKPNSAPVAAIDSITPNPARQIDTISFTGYGQDQDGKVVEYKWTSSIDGIISTEPIFKTSNLLVGEHRISFMVKDDRDVWSEPVYAQLTVRLPNQPPVASIESITPEFADVGQKIACIGKGSDEDGSVKDWEWDFGDSTKESGKGAWSFVGKAYSEPGEYKVSFKVKDNQGLWSKPSEQKIVIKTLAVEIKQPPRKHKGSRKAQADQAGKGALSINCDIAGADVFIGDEYQGATPLELNLDNGSYDVYVSKGKSGVWHKKVLVRPGKTIELNAVLKK